MLRPDTAGGAAMTANVVQFGRLLRRVGLDVDPGQTATFLRAGPAPSSSAAPLVSDG